MPSAPQAKLLPKPAAVAPLSAPASSRLWLAPLQLAWPLGQVNWSVAPVVFQVVFCVLLLLKLPPT